MQPLLYRTIYSIFPKKMVYSHNSTARESQANSMACVRVLVKIQLQNKWHTKKIG